MSRLPVAVPTILGLALGLGLAPSTALAQTGEEAGAAHARASLPSKAVWLAKVRTKLAGANAYLDQAAAASKDPTKLALVLDIDNTSIQTHYHWARPVKPTRRVAAHAVALGMHVFFVTGRAQSSLASIEPILFDDGYRYDEVLGRPKGVGLAASKQANRATIAARGFTVVMDIGNRATDLRGANVGRGIKLPSFHGLLS